MIMSKITETKNKTNAVKTEKTEPQFTLEKLRANCVKLFNVISAVFDGATTGLSPEKQYTIKEIAGLIEAWGKKEAK